VSVGEIALALAAGGLPVFPVATNKAPRTPHGFKDASAEPARVAELWRLYPGPLIGVPTGETTGFDVLDIDPRHGGNQWLDANRNRLPSTREHQTRSDGLHLFFRHRADMRNSAGRIAPGIDTRAEGGSVVWWPAAGLAVRNAKIITDWPAWLATALERPRILRPVEPPSIRGNGYAIAALRHAVRAVARAHEGSRNETLNREAFSISRFVLDGSLDPQSIADALAAAAFSIGLDRREIERTLASALRAAGIE
jgi:hypothetical protein